jgi:membrane fusion protein (multidrug efflux system)
MNKINRALAIVILFVCVVSGCTADSKVRPLASNATTTSNPHAPANSPVPVQVFEVQPFVAKDALSIPATITVEGTATVLSQRDGTITQVHAQEGGRVAKGQIIATLSSDDQLTQLRQAELEVSRLKIEEQQYESLVKVNRSELEREQLLFKDGLSSQSALERAKFKLDGATSEFEKTRIATRMAQARVEAVKFEIRKGTILAPIAGIAARRHVNLGTSVAKNDRLFEISPLTPLQVKFQLPQTERGRLAPGSIITLTLPDSDRALARARIRRLDPVADTASNTFGYLADVIDRLNLIPGTAVNVRLPNGVSNPSYWIPRAAFPVGADPQHGATATLLIVEDNRCAERTVLLNTVEGDQVEIVSGLSTGDRVIIAPPAHLKTGDLIEPG